MTLTAKGYNGQIEIDGEWLTIKRKGGMAKLTQGLKGDKRIPLANITSVQFKPATMMTNGYLQLSLLGSSETKGGILDATRDENSVMFKKGQAGEFEAVRDFVESHITRRLSAPANGHASAPAPVDRVGQLKSLAELRDSGVLSDDEFESEKTKILNG